MQMKSIVIYFWVATWRRITFANSIFSLY